MLPCNGGPLKKPRTIKTSTERLKMKMIIKIKVHWLYGCKTIGRMKLPQQLTKAIYPQQPDGLKTVQEPLVSALINMT